MGYAPDLGIRIEGSNNQRPEFFPSKGPVIEHLALLAASPIKLIVAHRARIISV